jgi:hypothetical protein
MDGPVIGKKYTTEQMLAMAQAFPELTIPGHVLRKDADGMYVIVPEAKAAGAFGRGKALDTAYRSKQSVEELFPTEPIRKRTPQERIASLADSLAEDMMAGRLTREHLGEIAAQSWRRGEPVSGDAVQAVAAAALQMAENKFEDAEHKKVVRTSPTD